MTATRALKGLVICAKVAGYHFHAKTPLLPSRWLRLPLAVSGALLSLTAAAQDRLHCPAPADYLPLPPSLLERFEFDTDAAPGALQLDSGSAEYSLGRTATLSDGVLIRRDDDYLFAERAELDQPGRRLTLTGNVHYSGLASRVRGQGADFDFGAGRIRFTDSEFALPDGRGRGLAELLQIDQTGTIRLSDVSYTSCPPGKDDWEIRAGDIKLDTAEGIGSARGLRLDFQGVPILYAPYLSFPISDARKTGFLVPNFGSSGRNGTDISVPWYWNLAPNYDATLTPRIMSRRGLQLTTEFRHLTRSSDSFANVAYLPNDNAFGENRTFATLRNRTYLPDGWRFRLDAQDVTDVNYFEDLGGSQSAASTTFLERMVVFDRVGSHWTLRALAHDYQVLDATLSPIEEPYRRLPQFVANGYWPDSAGGVDVRFLGELTNFDRETGVTGWRLNANPSVSLPLGRGGFYVAPELGFDYTAYRLSETAPGVDDSPEREAPTFSLDAGAVFERELSRGRQWLQTLEPRVLYVHTPYRQQDDLPVFDTILPDFNLVQIFRKRPLVGVDRLIDVDQVSLGVTSRIISSETGRTVLRGTLGQTRYLSEQGVTLPGAPVRTGESSDYIAELDVALYDNWSLELGHQWNSDSDETVKSEFRLQYRPETNKILNVGYRFLRDSLEQADISWSWPVGSRWNLVGRYNYSFRDDTTLERFAGIEYESCCWALRLVSRRYISRRDGTADSSVAIQLELKGLTSVGDPAGKLLERGILGYEAGND